MPWTLFWDMHSGGGTKEGEYENIYIEAPEDEAVVVFYNRFGHNPNRISCTCCGNDYSISESPTLEEASAYHRNCVYDKAHNKYIEKGDPSSTYRKWVSLSDYEKQKDVLVIRASEITDTERIGDVPESGYVWVGD